MHKNDDKTRYSINFDLSVEKLRENYSETHPEKAYALIERFLKDEGYEHVQGSGYHSADKIILQDNIDTLAGMHKEFPWLQKCIKSIYLTEIGDVYNVQYVFEDTVSHENDIEVKVDRKAVTWRNEFARSNKAEIDHSDDYEY